MYHDYLDSGPVAKSHKVNVETPSQAAIRPKQLTICCSTLLLTIVLICADHPPINPVP